MTIHNVIVDEWENVQKFDSVPLPVIKFQNDPVACACASYRVWKEHPARRWEDIETVVVWQDDIEEAERLKKYYRERLVIDALKNTTGAELSGFRKKLAKLVVDELPITKKEIGLLCRLPYFYEEDQDLDFIVANTNCDQLPAPTGMEPALTIIPMRRVLSSRAVGDYYHYWFKDTIYNAPHDLVIKHDNPLRSLIDGLFKLPEICIDARLFRKQFRGYHREKQYYQLGNVSLVN